MSEPNKLTDAQTLDNEAVKSEDEDDADAPDKKRNRMPNLTIQEKVLLADLAVANKDIVESKKTDAVTCKLKEEQWKAIAKQFNEQSTDGTQRDWAQLLAGWDMLKKRAKKAIAKDKVEKRLTSGGGRDSNPSCGGGPSENGSRRTGDDGRAGNETTVLDVQVDDDGYTNVVVEDMMMECTDDTGEVEETFSTSTSQSEKRSTRSSGYAPQRRRMPNFSHQEKAMLVELVVSHVGLIEDKRTDSATCQRKEDAWKMVARQFNKLPVVGAKRDWVQLKTAWDTIKKKAKKQKALERQERVRTGEAAPIVPGCDDITKQVIAVLRKGYVAATNTNKQGSAVTADGMILDCAEDDDANDSGMVHMPPEVYASDHESSSSTFSDLQASRSFAEAKSFARVKRDYYEQKLSMLQIEHASRLELLELQKAAARKQLLRRDDKCAPR